MCWFNDNEPFCADWLRNLFPHAMVDSRDFREIDVDDFKRHKRCHWFAGIGGWEYALGLAGWPRDRPVWTASLPCQPFSSAGKRAGEKDSRHLWPAFSRLVAECRPSIIFGEQVASDDGCQWLARVFADLEAMEYRVAGADLCAAGAGAPHIRQRLFWVADSQRERARTGATGQQGAAGLGRGGSSNDSRLGNADNRGCEGTALPVRPGRQDEGLLVPSRASEGCRMGDATGPRREGGQPELLSAGQAEGRLLAGPSDVRPWDKHEIVWCDERAFGRGWIARRVEPGTSPMAPRIPGTVGRLRAYGNSIVPQVAALFVRAYLEASKPC